MSAANLPEEEHLLPLVAQRRDTCSNDPRVEESEC